MANGILRELRASPRSKKASNAGEATAGTAETAAPPPASPADGERSKQGAAARERKPVGRIMTDAVLDRVDGAGLNRALLREAGGLARHPFATARAVGRFASGSVVATAKATARAVGSKTEGPLPLPAKDRRFNDPAWRENAVFFALLQQHLLRERLARDLVEASGLEHGQRRKARLASHGCSACMAPRSTPASIAC